MSELWQSYDRRNRTREDHAAPRIHRIIVTRHVGATQITGAKIDFSTMPTSQTVRVDALASGSTTSTSYVDIPGGSNATNLTMTFTKKYGSGVTKLLVMGHLANYFSSGGGNFYLGASIGGTDYQLAAYYENQVSSGRNGNNGMREITGLAAGSITCKLRLKTSGGTWQCDANFDAHLTVIEMPV